MNITARDKKLLAGLGIFIFVVLFGRFIIYPKLDSITTLKSDITALNSNYATNLIYKSKAKNIDSNIKILSVKLKDLRAAYPPKISISELIMVIKNLSRDSKLEIKSVNFQEYKAVSLQENKDNTAGSTNTANAANGSNSQQQTQTADASGADAANQQPTQQNAGANNISNPKILNYFYLWGLKSPIDNTAGVTGKDTANIADGKGYSVSVKIEAEGTNEQIKAFFASIEKLDVKTYCKSSSISKASGGKTEGEAAAVAENATANDNKLKLTAEIAFYGIMDKGAGGYYVLQDGKWNPLSPADDKQDLFNEYSGYEAASTDAASAAGSAAGDTGASKESTANDESTKSNKSDFYVVASAFGGGFAPSVSIGCNNPNKNEVFSRPVVYGDNRGIENAEIFIEEKAGKFYCKFKTDHEAYPDDKYSQTFEFIPEGKDLRLEILSSARNGEGDKAGINLNIINKTDKDLTYQIKFDDEKSPRVKIGKTVGSVRYEK